MATLRAKYAGSDATDKAILIVDQAAERVRLSLATSIYGQDALYLQKAIDADRYKSDGAISPLIEADMQAYQIDAKTACDQIQAARTSVLDAMKRSEVIRLRAKEQIRKTGGNPFDVAKAAKADLEALTNAGG